MSLNGWKTDKLGNMLTLKRGYDLPQQDRVIGNAPIFSSAGLSGYHNEAKIKGPGVITGRYGTLGEIFYSENDYWPHNTTLYVRDFKGNYPKFIYYFLRTLGFERNNDKTSVPGLNRNDLHEMSVTIPSVPAQKKIASILSSLDDKIELNRQTNATLEAIPQALFKEWFVDFNYPRAFKSATHDDKSEVPQRWNRGKLGQLLSFKNGKSSPERMADHKYPVYGANGVIGHASVYNTSADSTIIGRVGSFCGAVYYANQDCFVTENAIIATPVTPHSSIYCFIILQNLKLNNYRTGSGQPLLNQTILSCIDVIVPPDDLLSAFEIQVRPLYDLVYLNEQQNHTLTQLRDSLLPRLMKGEL